MATNKGDQRKSKVEFDATYFKIFDDSALIIQNNFGGKGEIVERKKDRIRAMADRVTKVVADIGTHIRISNSIFPQCKMEAEARRTHQDKAIGLCYDLLTKYQNMMHELEVPDDKYVEEIKHIYHEINCLKKWRESDNKRFRF